MQGREVSYLECDQQGGHPLRLDGRQEGLAGGVHTTVGGDDEEENVRDL